MIIDNKKFLGMEKIISEYSGIEYAFLLITKSNDNLTAQIHYIFDHDNLSLDDLKKELDSDVYILIFDKNELNTRKKNFQDTLSNVFDELSDYAAIRNEIEQVFYRCSSYDKMQKDYDNLEQGIAFIFEAYSLSKKVTDSLYKEIQGLNINFLYKKQISEVKKNAKLAMKSDQKLYQKTYGTLEEYEKDKQYYKVKDNLQKIIQEQQFSEFLMGMFFSDTEEIKYKNRKAFTNDVKNIRLSLYKYIVLEYDNLKIKVSEDSYINGQKFLSQCTRRFNYINLYKLDRYYGNITDTERIEKMYDNLTKKRMRNIQNMGEVSYFEYQYLLEEQYLKELEGFYQMLEDEQVEKEKVKKELFNMNYEQRKYMYKSKGQFKQQYGEYFGDIDPELEKFGLIDSVIEDILQGNYEIESDVDDEIVEKIEQKIEENYEKSDEIDKDEEEFDIM